MQAPSPPGRDGFSLRRAPPPAMPDVDPGLQIIANADVQRLRGHVGCLFAGQQPQIGLWMLAVTAALVPAANPAVSERLEAAGFRWAIADAVTRVSDKDERAAMIAAGLSRAQGGGRLPADLRGIAVLEALALRAMRRGGRPLMEGRGASVALAETVGSVAAGYCVDRSQFVGVGMEINANHIGSVKTGSVKAIGKIVHAGTRTHIWQVDIFDESNDRLICTGRLTVMIVPRK